MPWRGAGDAYAVVVNMAARMEASGVPGRIRVPAAMREQLPNSFVLEKRGLVEVRGKGAVETWFLVAAMAPRPYCRDARLLWRAFPAEMRRKR
jgi:class 3 adenylate cyclase